MFEAIGPGARFRELSNKHYAEIERAQGNDTPGKLYAGTWLVSKDGE